MADLPVPKAEAKPSTSELITDELINRFDNAQTLARVMHARAGAYGWDLVVASTRDALEEIAPILIAAGRAQAAADVRDHPGPDPSPASPAWWAGYSEALRDAARIAEGSDGTRTDRDETTLPASTSGGIHGETSTGGSAS